MGATRDAVAADTCDDSKMEARKRTQSGTQRRHAGSLHGSHLASSSHHGGRHHLVGSHLRPHVGGTAAGHVGAARSEPALASLVHLSLMHHGLSAGVA